MFGIAGPSYCPHVFANVFQYVLWYFPQPPE